MTADNSDLNQIAVEVRRMVNYLMANGRADLALQAIGMSNLEMLHVESARTRLSRLIITSDYRFVLADYGGCEVEMSPIHKALYMLFLRHPEGIEAKCLVD